MAATAPPPAQDRSPGGARLSRVGLRGRLLGAILVVALTTLAVGIIGVQRMSVLSDSAERVYSDGTVPLRELKELQLDWWTHEAYSARSNITSAGPEVNAIDAAKAADAQKALTAQIEVVAKLKLTGDVADSFTVFQKDAAKYGQLLQDLQGKFATNDMAGPAAIIGQLQPLEKDAVAALDKAAAAMEKVALETA